MASNQSGTSQFIPAYPSVPQTNNERSLLNDMLRGTITLPVYLQDFYGTGVGNTEESKICTIPFYLEENFSFSLGNDWKPLVDMSMFESINSIINLGQLAFAEGQAQVSLASSQMALATWRGSEQPEFNIRMTFVCTQRNYNPVNIITALSETALPRPVTTNKNKNMANVRTGAANTVRGIGNITGSIVEPINASAGESTKLTFNKVANMVEQTGLLAPLYYAPKFGDDGRVENNPNFTLTLQIGNWFRASNLIVTKISNIEFSKEVVAPPTDFKHGDSLYNTGAFQDDRNWGFPLYARCSLGLKPITYITAEEFNSYFISEPATKGNTNNNTSTI